LWCIHFYDSLNSLPDELEGWGILEVCILLQDDVNRHHGVLVGRELALSLLVVDRQLLDLALALLAQHIADGFQQRHDDVLE
jgi:hypothetical protein